MFFCVSILSVLDSFEHLRKYEWKYARNKSWNNSQKEIKAMLQNGFKMEVESLITKDISYVTEAYVPERLKKQDWLD